LSWRYSPILQVSPIEAAKAAFAASGSAYPSVAAGIRPIIRRVIRVVRAIEAVVVVAAAEATPSSAEVIVVEARHVIDAKAADVISTKTSNATAVKAAHVTATEAAAHMASAESATTVSSASAATAGLCARGNKAAGKHCACQNHHHSSSHDILHLRWADFPPSSQALAISARSSQRRDGLEMGMPVRRLH
jgi:hypothetical protein